MKRYRIKFTNTHTFTLYGISRKEVLQKAIRATRGLLTELQQSVNLEFCTIIRQ